jgi:multiple sugar transport system substrate-binding protein
MFNYYKLTFFCGFILILYVLFVYDRPEVLPDKRTEVKILFNPSAKTAGGFQKILDQFEKENPDIRVTWLRAPGSYYVKVQTMMVGYTCADIINFSGKRVNAFKVKNTLLNLMPFMKKDKYNLNDYFPVGLADAQMTNTELFYLPIEGSGTVLFYNKNLFDKAKMKYPDNTWTWGSFLKAGQELTQDTDGDGRNDQVGLSLSYWWGEVIPWIWANGGSMVNKEQTKCLLNKPEALGAMQFLIDLDNKYHITDKSLGGTESAGIYENFASGRIGMFCALAYILPRLSDACGSKDLRWGMALPPKGKHGRPIRYTSSGFVIWKETRVPNESWRLLKFLMKPEIMDKFCTANEWIPSRKSLVLKKSYLDNPDTPYDENVLIESLKMSRPLDNIFALRAISRDFSIAYERAKLGISPLKTEMDRVVAEADNALDRAKKERHK